MTATSRPQARPRRDLRLVLGFVLLAVLLVLVGGITSAVLSDPCRRLNQPAPEPVEVVPTPQRIPGVGGAPSPFAAVVPTLGPLRLALAAPDGVRLAATDGALLVSTAGAVTAVSPGFGTVGSTRDLTGFELYTTGDGAVSVDPGTGRVAVFDEQLLQQSCGEVDARLPVLAAGGALVLQHDGDTLVGARLDGERAWSLDLGATPTDARLVRRGAVVATTDGILLVDTVGGDVRERWDLDAAAIVGVADDRVLVRGDDGGAVLDLVSGEAVPTTGRGVPAALLGDRVLAVDGCTLSLDGDPIGALLPPCGDVSVDDVVTTGNGFTSMVTTVAGRAPTVLVFGPRETT